MTTTTYLGSGDPSRHRRDYRPQWLDNLADDVTIEGSVLTGLAESKGASAEQFLVRTFLKNQFGVGD